MLKKTNMWISTKFPILLYQEEFLSFHLAYFLFHINIIILGLLFSVLRLVWWCMYWLKQNNQNEIVFKPHLYLQQAKSRGKNLGTYFDSWVGGINLEKGGTSLKFEPLLDDTNLVDMLWLRRFVLRAMEMLYQEKKWEKLVDLALRFSALTKWVVTCVGFVLSLY